MSRTHHRIVRFIAIAFGLIALLACGLALYRSRVTVRITIVVPQGYHGMITISGNRLNGEVVEGGSHYTLRIPSNGHLELKGENPTYRWHVLDAVWSDNTPLRVDELGKMPDTVALREADSGGNERNPVSKLFVGTLKEQIEASNEEMRR